MKIFNIITDFIIIFIFSSIFLFISCKLAKKIGLVDKPNYRKHHQGKVPLVGGITIFTSLCFSFLYTKHYIPNTILYLICSGILVVTGILDDLYDISIFSRVIIQGLVAIFMMIFSNHHINSLGHIFGPFEVFLGHFGYILTLFSVWASINAFNMVDGVDGLLGSISCVALGTIGVLLYFDKNFILSLWCFFIISSIIPCFILNLGLCGNRYKIFMGDSGSTMIGFTIIWLLIQSTQGHSHSIAPVTALWIIAVPLIDMIVIMYRRIRNGVNPFYPDRQHLHYIIIRAGFSSQQALIIITTIAILFAFFGIKCRKYTEYIMFFLWISICFLYGCILKYYYQIILLIKRINKKLNDYTKTYK